MFSEEEKQRLKNAMLEFCVRVMEGKDCAPEETRAMPNVLHVLYCLEEQWSR